MRELDFKSMRAAMVDSQLRTNGVTDPNVVAAFAAVPREAFVPETARVRAYADAPVPLNRGRGLNPPLATGRLFAEARIMAGHRVMIIGAATGYACALAVALGAEVIGVESDEALADVARTALEGNPNAAIVVGPLAKGHADGAPYDVILIDGAVELVPDALSDQLVVGGRIVTGLVDDGVTRLARGQRASSGLSLLPFADVETVILPGFARAPVFSF